MGCILFFLGGRGGGGVPVQVRVRVWLVMLKGTPSIMEPSKEPFLRDLRTHILRLLAQRPYYIRLLGYFDAQGLKEPFEPVKDPFK